MLLSTNLPRRIAAAEHRTQATTDGPLGPLLQLEKRGYSVRGRRYRDGRARLLSFQQPGGGRVKKGERCSGQPWLQQRGMTAPFRSRRSARSHTAASGDDAAKTNKNRISKRASLAPRCAYASLARRHENSSENGWTLRAGNNRTGAERGTTAAREITA